MNKKFVLILVAACIVCLGAGIVIGMGISQNNLSATGATEESVDLPTAEDFAAMDKADLKKAFKDYTEKLRLVNKRQEKVRTALAETRDIIEAGSEVVVTEDLYRNLRFILEARKDETFKHAICLSRLNKLVFFSPHDKVKVPLGIYEFIEDELEDTLELFNETAVSYKTAIDDIKKALSDKRA